MAKILFGNMVADARGKLGGIVYSRNAAGAYARQKVSPVQPRSPAQLGQRSDLMDVSKLWGTLTQSQRTAWAGFAQTHKFVDVFGLAKKYSGQQMYMHCNLGLLSNNLALINDPPADLEVIPLGSIGAASSTSGVVQSVAVTAAGTGYTSQPTVGFSGGAGSGAAATSTLVPTTVASYTVGAGGTGYTTAPTVTVTGGGGTGATATATVVSGVVTAVTLVIAGSGYTTRPTVGFTGGGGTGATATAVLTATGVSSVIMTADGTGYTSAPTVAFTGGSGSGAAGTASITFATSGLALVFTPTPTTLPLEVWASFQMPVGRVYAKNLLRRIGTFGDGSTSPLDLSAAYTAVFGELPQSAPYRIVVEANFINPVNGARSVKQRGDLIQLA